MIRDAKGELSVSAVICQTPILRPFPALLEMSLKFQLVLFACLVLVVLAKDSKPKKLQIGIKKRVENCTIKSKRGDLLHMHYTVLLLICYFPRRFTMNFYA